MRKRPELLVYLYHQAVSKYIKYKDRLDRSIRSGRFKSYRRSEQSKFIHRLNKLKAQIDQYQLKLKVAIAAGALALTLTALEPVQAQTNLGPFELQKRSSNPLRSAFALESGLAFVAADIDGDGDQDVLAGGNSKLLFFKNNGTPTQPRFDLQTGPWVPATGEGSPFNSIVYTAGDGNVAPAFANFDGDADLDLFLGTSDKGFRYFVQNADGSFTEQTGAWDPTGGTGNPLFNFDENATVLNGTFDLKPTFVDYDNDGDLDVAFGHDYDSFGNTGTQIHLIENDGTNRFPGPNVVNQAANPFEGIVVGGSNYDAIPRFVDVDGTGDLELFLGNYGGELRFYRSALSGVYIEQTGAWNGGTNAGNPLELGFSFGNYSAVDFVDLDNDGDLDALIFGENGNIKYEPSHIRYLRNDGNFVYTELYGPENPFDGIPQIVDNGSQGSIYPAFIDYDLDSHPDVWVTEYFSPILPGSNVSRVTLYNNNQTEEGFRFTSTFNLTAPFNAFPVEANINGTGGDDLVTAQSNGQISFFSNDGGGAFSPIASNDLNTKVAATSQVYPAFVDMDSDGDEDAFVARGTAVEFYRNDGPPAAPVFTSITGPGNPMDGLVFAAGSVLTAGDANNDGFKDLFVTNPAGTPGAVRFFVNQGDGVTFTEYTTSDRPLDVASLNPVSAPKMVDVDQDGDKDIFVGSSIFPPTSDYRIQFYENTNFAPVVLTNTTNVTFTAGGGAVTLAGTLELNDNNDGAGAEDTEVILAKVRITANFNSSQDVLSFTPVGNITGSYDATTGTLTLSGTDAMAIYETALQSVQYNNTSGTPTTLTRTITWYAFDHDATDPRLDAIADGSMTVTIVGAPNTPPTLSTPGAAVTFNGSSVNIDNGLNVSDSDDINLESATISIVSGFVSGEDVLSFTDQNNITGTYNASTGILTLTGTSSVLNYQTALRSIQFGNNAIPRTSGTRQVQFLANDGNVNSNTTSINVLVPNQAPVLNLSTPSVTYSGSAIALDNALTATDVDDLNLESATVSVISGFVNGEDVLSFTNQNGITGSYSAATGVLTLTGTSSVANYQTALRSITYQNNLATPVATNRIIRFVANDGSLNSTPRTLTVAYPSANATPSLSTTTTSVTFSGTPANIDNALIVADADNSIASATVQVGTGFVAGEDVLEFTNQNGITGSYNAASGLLTLTGVTTVANWQTALRSILYNNTLPDRTNANRTITITVNDGIVSSNAVNVTLVVPNQVPSLVLGTASNTFTGTDLPLASALTIADTDDVNLAGATVAVSAGFVNGEDQLIFTNQNGISGTYNAATGVLTLTGSSSIANYQTALRTVAYRNTAADRTNANRTLTFTVNDGTVNSTGASLTLAVPNQAPTLTGGTTTGNFTGTDLVLDAGLTLSDIDDINFSTATVSISAGFVAGEDQLIFVNQNGITGTFNSATGTLTLTGNSSIANYQAALRSVVYRNTAVDRTNANRTISFIVGDGTTNSTANAIVLTVPNLAPAITLLATSINYTGSDLVLDGNLTVADADDANLASASVSITAGFVTGEDELVFTNQNGITGSFNSATGVLTLSGSATVGNYQAALRTVAYRNTAGIKTLTNRGIAFQVNDGQVSTVSSTLQIALTNTAPVIAGGVNSLYLSGDHLLAANLTVTDADNSQLQSAEVQIAAGVQPSEDVLLFANQNGITGSYTAATGTLVLSGVSSVANYETALRSVAYRNNASAPNTTDRSITIRVSDGNATSNVVTFTLAINKPPVVDPYTESTGAGSNVEIDLEDLVADPDNTFDELTITVNSQQGATATIVNGVLTLNYSAIPNYRGADTITITVCDPSGRCQTQTITITVEATLSVFNGVSPNGDGNNDYFKILFLPAESTVAIYNRWGDLVFEMKDYDHNLKSKRFEGLNSNGNELLSGTYFYRITLPNGEMLTGHLTLKK